MNQTGLLAIVPAVLRSLSEGNILRRIFSIIIKVQGALYGITVLVLVIFVLRGSFDNNLPVLATIAGIIASAILLVAGVGLVQIFFYRADTVMQLGDSPFTVIPIISVFIRLWGEALAYCYTVALVEMIVVLVISLFDERVRFAMRFLSEFMPGSSYGRYGGAAGNIAMSLGMAALIPVFIISIAYFLSEAIFVSVDMARNIRLLVIHSGAAPQYTAPVMGQAENTGPQCPACASPVVPGDTFCTICGHKLT